MKNDSHKSIPKSSEQPDDRKNHERDKDIREENLDKTIEDSFPASDPPSSTPDPDEKEDAA
jgi:hypothetical protein